MSTTTPTLREALASYDAADAGSSLEVATARMLSRAASRHLALHTELVAALRALSNYAGNGPEGHPCHTARALLARLDAEKGES